MQYSSLLSWPSAVCVQYIHHVSCGSFILTAVSLWIVIVLPLVCIIVVVVSCVVVAVSIGIAIKGEEKTQL